MDLRRHQPCAPPDRPRGAERVQAPPIYQGIGDALRSALPCDRAMPSDIDVLIQKLR